MAPFFAMLLKSGLGLVANAALEKGTGWLEKETGVKVDLNTAPSETELVAFKQYMMEHEETLQKIQLEKDHLSAELFKAVLADTQGARQREVDLANSNAPQLNKIITPVLAIGVLVLTFLLFGFVMFDESAVEASRKDLLVYILGVLSAISTQVVAYYFGSSVGSKDKDSAIAGMLK